MRLNHEPILIGRNLKKRLALPRYGADCKHLQILHAASDWRLDIQASDGVSGNNKLITQVPQLFTRVDQIAARVLLKLLFRLGDLKFSFADALFSFSVIRYGTANFPPRGGRARALTRAISSSKQGFCHKAPSRRAIHQ